MNVFQEDSRRASKILPWRFPCKRGNTFLCQPKKTSARRSGETLVFPWSKIAHESWDGLVTRSMRLRSRVNSKRNVLE